MEGSTKGEKEKEKEVAEGEQGEVTRKEKKPRFEKERKEEDKSNLVKSNVFHQCLNTKNVIYHTNHDCSANIPRNQRES